MFSKSRTNQPLIQPILEEGSSYICYTYFDTKENINRRQFDLEQAVSFFSCDRKEISAKYGSEPLSLMLDQCIICDGINLEGCNAKPTGQVKKLWEKNAIPDEISRYVLELNISATSADILYNQKKISILGQHIISKREDTISKANPNWIIGQTQIVEIAAEEIKTEEQSRCRIM